MRRKKEDIEEELSLERTLLSRERTMLSFFRTGFASIILGFGLISLLKTNLFNYLGIFCIIIGLAFFIIGFFYFPSRKSVQREIKRLKRI